MMKHPDKRKRLQTRPLPMGKKSRVFLAVYSAAVLCVCCMPVTASAAGDPLTVINNLSDFIFGVIRAVGLILLGWVCPSRVTTRPSAATAFSRWQAV